VHQRSAAPVAPTPARVAAALLTRIRARASHSVTLCRVDVGAGKAGAGPGRALPPLAAWSSSSVGDGGAAGAVPLRICCGDLHVLYCESGCCCECCPLGGTVHTCGEPLLAI